MWILLINDSNNVRTKLTYWPFSPRAQSPINYLIQGLLIIPIATTENPPQYLPHSALCTHTVTHIAHLQTTTLNQAP